MAFKRLHLGCSQAKFVPISLQPASHVELETQMEALFGSGQEHADVGLSSLPLQAELAVLLSTKIGRIQARKAAVELADLQPHLGGHGIQLLTEAVDDGSPNRAGFCHQELHPSCPTHQDSKWEFRGCSHDLECFRFGFGNRSGHTLSIKELVPQLFQQLLVLFLPIATEVLLEVQRFPLLV